jgi:hypothetical protein
MKLVESWQPAVKLVLLSKLYNIMFMDDSTLYEVLDVSNHNYIWHADR